MVLCPFKAGNLIILEDKYEIKSLITEAEKYWLLGAEQLATGREVLVKVFINEKFSSIDLLELAWKQDIRALEIEKKYEGSPIEVIESGTKDLEEKKYFLIVFSYLEEVTEQKQAIIKEDEEKQADKAPEIDDVIETPPIPKVPTTGAVPEETVEVTKDFELKEEEEEDDVINETEVLKESEEKVEESLGASLEVVREEEPPVESVGEEPRMTPPETAPPASPRVKEKEKKRKGKPSLKTPAPAKRVPTDIDEVIIEREEKDYMKHITMDYFDRMNPQNYYPLTLSISDFLEAKKAPIVNPVTGERKVQKQSEMEVTLENPIVVIRPTIPGCNVVPNVIETDFRQTKDEVTFYITPGVKGKIIGQIEFLNAKRLVHTIDLEAKVVDPNFARVVAFFGVIASFAPKIISFLGVNLGLSLSLNELWGIAEGTFGNMNIASLIALVGIVPVTIASILVRISLKPKANRTSFKLKDFRLKDLKS